MKAKYINFTGSEFSKVFLDTMLENIHENLSIISLNLSNCRLTSEKISSISLISDNHVIRELNLSENLIGNEGGETILKLLENTNTLVNLNVAKNDFRDEGMIFIAKGVLRNKSILRLNVGSNRKCTDRSMAKIAKGLSKHKMIMHLDMSHNNWGTLTLMQLGALLEENKSIKEMKLD